MLEVMNVNVETPGVAGKQSQQPFLWSGYPAGVENTPTHTTIQLHTKEMVINVGPDEPSGSPSYDITLTFTHITKRKQLRRYRYRSLWVRRVLIR